MTIGIVEICIKCTEVLAISKYIIFCTKCAFLIHHDLPLRNQDLGIYWLEFLVLFSNIKCSAELKFNYFGKLIDKISSGTAIG